MKQLLPAIFLLLFAGSSFWEPEDSDIKTVRDYLAEIKYDLYNNEIPSFSLIGFTGDAVSRLKNNDLSEMYSSFVNLYKTSAAADTLISILNLFSERYFLHYGETIYSDLISSQKLKTILFITSVSCECTLKQCSEYEQAFYGFIHSLEEKPEFLLVDTFYEEKLQAKHDVNFTPVFIILDKDNTEIVRYTREEDIKIKIANFLAERD